MRITALVEALVSAGATPEMILVAVRTTESANEQALEQSREKTRSRVAKWRATKVGNVTDGHVTLSNNSRVGDAPVEDKPLNQKIEPQEEKKETRSRASFDAFWTIYPHKVGKADASKAFDRALRRTDLETMLAGLRRYVGKTDDRPWCNPATWLNQDRWTDQPATVVPVARGSPNPKPPHIAHLFATVSMRTEPDDRPKTDPFDIVRYLPAAAGSGHT